MSEWEKIKIGDQASFTITITSKMIKYFIALTGDNNFLHTDDSFARSKGFSKRVAHGLLLTSLFSRLVGKYFLGDHNLYLSQNVSFKKPVFVGDKVLVTGRVENKTESINVIIIKTMILFTDGTIAASGEAMVKSL